MITVQQAIFTAAPDGRQGQCQLVAASPAVAADDARELAVWGPTHDSLPWPGPGECCNFHPLPSGAYCISRTTRLAAEADRSAGLLWTHCLIASPEVLAHFANNPFALDKVARAAGLPPPGADLPEQLPPLLLAGRAAGVDQSLLGRLAEKPGPKWMGSLVQAALDAVCLAVAGTDAAEELIAGLMSCLPSECRPEFSFTTGLKFSPARPFRIVGHVGPAEEMHCLQHRYNLTVLDFSLGQPETIRPLDGWGHLIERALTGGRNSFLATQLSKRRFELAPSDLSALGLQLLEDLEAAAMRGEGDEPETAAEKTFHTRAHAAHPPRGAAAGAAVHEPGPSKTLDPDSPEVLARLEQLDDAVWEAVGGNPQALQRLCLLWPQMRGDLGDELLAESREQYLRYALSIWEEYMGNGGIRNPTRAVHALDVLCVLFDRV